MADMLRERADEVAFSTRVHLEHSTLGKSANAAKAVPKKMPKKTNSRCGANLQPGDFGYGDPLQGKKFGGAPLTIENILTKPATDYSGKGRFGADPNRKRFNTVDKSGAQPGDFGYGNILKGKKFGGAPKTIETILKKPASDYTPKKGSSGLFR